MSGNLSPTDIANLALMRLGQNQIQSLQDPTNPNAIAVNLAYAQSLAEVARETPWNCLKKRALLSQLANPDPAASQGEVPPGTLPWAPNTNYAVNSFVTYAGYLYQCLIANTSSGSFTVDLTYGYWFQTNIFAPNYLGPWPPNAGPLYEWAYGYQLPADFVLLIELNGTGCWPGKAANGSLYEVYQQRLYCDTPFANIKYNCFEQDSTKYDSLFTACLVLNLAAAVATTLRKDEATLSQRLKAELVPLLQEARTKNAGESNPRRYVLASQSRFVRSRRNSTNG